MHIPQSVLLYALSALVLSSADVTARPNVLFIAVDDLRPELGCYGAEHIQSPNIDRLAAAGTLFRHAYCQVAVCGASRASLLSGCRPETTGCWDFGTPLRSQMPDVLTLPGHFQKSGYQTASIGKVYHAHDDDASSWSVNAHHEAPVNARARTWVKTPYDQLVNHPRIRGFKLGPSTENGGDAADDDYRDGDTARRGVALLEKFATGEEPFFLAVGFFKPHLPFNAPGKYWDLYDREAIEVPPREPVIGEPRYARSRWFELKAYTDIGRRRASLSDDKTRELIHGYYAAVSYMDAQVGRLLDALDRLGITDETIVVLWGDHGYYLGDFGLWCKHTNYEVATRVPLIVRAPGKAGSQGSDALVELVDLYPTLCELADLPVPSHCQGTSMTPLLEDPGRAWKTAAFSQYKRGRPDRRFLGTSVRTQQFRYTEWRSEVTGVLDAVELFDFKSDPLATVNVARDPAYAEFLPRLAQLAKKSGTGVTPE